MLSLVEVKCPHCQMRGQVMVPPMGALVLGPCPQCRELLVVFCGRVLPLDKEVMIYGDDGQKHAHLMDVLTAFLDERVQQLLDNSPELSDEIRKQVEQVSDTTLPDPLEPKVDAAPSASSLGIDQHELEQFVNVDLKLLDDKEYFNAVFGHDKD